MQHSVIRSEADRLAALDEYDILDTPRERDFDDVAALASEICGTPIAVVNLIGQGRQFFKAEVGLGVRATPLESSFCAKAILEEEFLLIPDATKDPRFDCNPLVTGEPGLRFYAGALLKTEKGHAIGTVCVLDFTPRNLNSVQERTLRVLARQVMKQLDLRLALKERDRAEAQREFLNQELSHRLKNTLAMVQAIAKQTLKDVSERHAVEAFEKRVLALARAHDVLMRESWATAPILNVAELVLALHGNPSRIQMEGPNIDLGPKSTLYLSLVLHELATNAAKYGSLSADAGQVRLSWRVDANESEPEFTLTWEETGGPPVQSPARMGFGSRLIDMGLVGAGGVEKQFLSSGLRTEFRALLKMMQAN